MGLLLDTTGMPAGDRVAAVAAAMGAATPACRLVHEDPADVRARVDLWQFGDASADPGAAVLGVASVDLVRALIMSAGHDERRSARVLAESLLSRVRAHVRRHLRDPGLRAESIAAAHNISTRQLYRLCEQAGFSLEQWIIEERLAGARDELAAGGSGTIGEVGRRWGFTDPAHFSRRFRAAYGVTPREWRRS